MKTLAESLNFTVPTLDVPRDLEHPLGGRGVFDGAEVFPVLARPDIRREFGTFLTQLTVGFLLDHDAG